MLRSYKEKVASRPQTCGKSGSWKTVSLKNRQCKPVLDGKDYQTRNVRLAAKKRRPRGCGLVAANAALGPLKGEPTATPHLQRKSVLFSTATVWQPIDLAWCSHSCSSSKASTSLLPICESLHIGPLYQPI